MNKVWEHFKTITYHKYLVAKGCFRIGLYRQGLLHDLSKYSPSEFLVGAKFYQGNRSPNNAEREQCGYSSAWLHHKGRNKHHYEYWVDYNGRDSGDIILVIPMPANYLAEMVIDRIAASKVYRGTDYTNQDPLQYYLYGKGKMPIHERTAAELEKILRILAEKGEVVTYRYIREELLKKGY